MRTFNREGVAVVYNTYQGYLKKTLAATLTALAEHLAASAREKFTLGLKLVRGAYILSDNRSLIHDTKQQTDDAYNSIAQGGALRQQTGNFGAPGGEPFPSVNILLASHNPASILAARKLPLQRLRAGQPTVPVAFAQLHGMSDEVSFSLLQAKDDEGKTAEVYKCTTWGSMGECLAYLLRRAVENRDAFLRTGDEYMALKAEVWRRLKSVVYLFTRNN
ncbi:FAD-linked oxidoreductase-like protein [Xylariales sp. PMI_506]|nr:FAD-linked oxidoreductase-like protein [Xylariales sp. PMI_506]